MMPQDEQIFREDFSVHNFYIAKNSSGSCGRHTIISNQLFELTSLEPDIIQEYDTGFLQIDGHKMDLRVDVLVTQTYPLVAYYNREGFAKFAKVSYQQPSEENKNIKQIHLTNIAVNNALHEDHYMVDDNLSQTIPFTELFDILDN